MQDYEGLLKKLNSLSPAAIAAMTASEREDLKQLLEENVYQKCEGSLYEYLKIAWRFIDSSEYKDDWYLQAIAEHGQACVQGEIRNLIVNVPPRCGKSTLFSVALPTWTWGPANKPETKFLSTTYDSKLSTRDALRSRRLLQTSWYLKRWGQRFRLTSDQNVKTRYNNDRFGERLSTSVGGASTGEGYDILIVDDPLNAKKEASSVALNECIEWWRGVMSTRANDPATARRIIIMQRIHERDLVGYLLENELDDSWCHLVLPMRYEQRHWVSPLGWVDPREEEGDLLCPSRFPEAEVKKLEKSLGPYKAAAQLQQRPAPATGGIIREEMLQYYGSVSPTQFNVIIQAWDLTFDDGVDSDFVCGQVWGKMGPDRYLIDMYRERADIVAQCEAIARMYAKYPQTRIILIENKANGQSAAKILKHAIDIGGEKVQVCGVQLVEPKDYGGNKEARLKNCIAEFMGRNVYFPLPSLKPWVKTLEAELKFFPKAAHDDTVDALAYALNWFAKFSGDIENKLGDRELYELLNDKNRAKQSPLYVFGGENTRGGIKGIFN